MTRPQNKNLKPFKKGQSGNPSGKPKLPDDVRLSKQLTYEEYCRLSSKFLLMSDDEIDVVLKSNDTNQLEQALARSIKNAAKLKGFGSGDQLEKILTRLIGSKPKGDTPGSFNFNFHMLPRSQVIDLGMEAIRYLSKGKEHE